MKSAIGILSLIITLSIIPFAFADIPFDQVAPQDIKIYVGNDIFINIRRTDCFKIRIWIQVSSLI